jgi:hypothetical protein
VPAATYTPIPTVTPTTAPATSTPIPSNTRVPTVSELPQSGSAEVTILGIGVGALLLVAGLFLVAL